MTANPPLDDTACFYCSWADPKLRWTSHALGVALATGVGALWATVFSLGFTTYLDSIPRALALLPAYLVLMAMHEGIHAVFARWVSGAERVWFQGIQNGALIVRSSGLVKKAPRIVELVAPFVTLSFILPGLSAAVFPAWGWLFGAMAVFNAMASSADLVLAWQTARCTPPGAVLGGDGDNLYYLRKKEGHS